MATRIPRIAITSLLNHSRPRRAPPINLRLLPRPLHTTSPPHHPKPPPKASHLASLLLTTSLLLTLPLLSKSETSSLDPSPSPSLPLYHLSEIHQSHGPTSPEPWVTLNNKVYNITSWLPAHPGGDVILRAAGGSLEPYWEIFTIHNSPHVKEILEEYLIGYIHPSDLGPDGKPPATSIEDPFVNDPVRDKRLITHTYKPRNAEPPNQELDKGFYTENGMFYVRHHMWVPEEDGGELVVELPDGEERRYTIGELKKRFKTERVTATLQCSGNRRNDMTRHAGKTNGLQWGVGAISNAVWEGVKLKDLLKDAGLELEQQENEKDMHAWFVGREAYSASIPLPKATDQNGDVLLAWGMNGETLPRDHGFPLRVVVPGNVAARSVKWLSRIVISDEEATSQWQRRDYKSFGPNEGGKEDWDKAPSIQEMPVTSAITGVWVGECVKKVSWMPGGGIGSGERVNGGGRTIDMAATPQKVGFTPKPTSSDGNTPCPETTPDNEPIALQGYAYSGGGRKITRVDVSLDGGATWDQAQLVDDCSNPATPCYGNKSWGWTRWRYNGTLPVLSLPPTVPLPPALAKVGQDCEDGFGRSVSLMGQLPKKQCTTLIVKATDESYNTQPESHKGIYNVRGNLATAWHRVKICPECTKGNGGKGGLVWNTGETYGCGFRKEAEEVREGMRAASESTGNGK
uniref:Nitrate reductase [NADPH] n=1 Tax=Podospora anserina (strain S / ATCC MYA-4624 / DSM 980 / FGSC 10383) TaxID=515849 RepID=A0A090CN83_PODAN|nr:Putative Sulfite oxidase [Podospora anserina S mat+]